MGTEKKIIAIGAVIVILAIVGYFVVAQQLNAARVSVPPEQASAKDVKCEITVRNPIGIPLIKNGDLIIESVQCQQQFVANCARFGIFSDTGTLRIEADGGLGSAADVKVSEGSAQGYSLDWCGSKFTSNFKIKLFNDNNEILYTREVVLK